MLNAFDPVSHYRLVNKIRTCGTLNPPLSWLPSHFSDRFQVGNISDYFSQPCANNSRVIWGSILGRLLFLPYNNDIFKVIHLETPFLFVDDIIRIYSFEAGSSNRSLAPTIGEIIYPDNWRPTWPMEFSADKFSNNTNGTPSISGMIISASNVVKD